VVRSSSKVIHVGGGVGSSVGASVGNRDVGAEVGNLVGAAVGPAVGEVVGALVGATGIAVGNLVGAAVGPDVGEVVGALVGATGAGVEIGPFPIEATPAWFTQKECAVVNVNSPPAKSCTPLTLAVYDPLPSAQLQFVIYSTMRMDTSKM
jgi:hypothetical protein